MSTAPSLQRTLTVADTFSIATGAMFSSGFFLLPGIAAAMTGTSVVLAYLTAGLLMIPAMMSKAELSTAMPRSGGSYFFVDRAIGPMAGAVAGISTWIALVLKSAFALVGLGAYLALLVGVPIVPVAAGAGIAFTLLNLRGADHSATVQRWLVAILLGALGALLVGGAGSYLTGGIPAETTLNTEAFLGNGWAGFAATVGIVSISYAGLTKVASVAEEVRDPDRTLPRGMFLALGVTTLVYVLGVTLVLAVVPADVLYTDMAPVARAAEVVFAGPFSSVGTFLVVAAAIAAFISTANAGIMASSRYPLAMARDKLVPETLSEVSKAGVPVPAVLLTGGLVVAAVALDVAAIAKLASAVQLMVFAMVSLAVIVMRESQIDGYEPGFKSPLYPWMQIAGMVVSLALISAMGWKSLVFALGLIIAAIVFFFAYARKRVDRRGALRHVFRRLGEDSCPEIEHELGSILLERALEDGGRRTSMVGRVRLGDGSAFDALVNRTLGDGHAPPGVLVVMVEREGDAFVPNPREQLRCGDRLTLVGQPDALAAVAPPKNRDGIMISPRMLRTGQRLAIPSI